MKLFIQPSALNAQYAASPVWLRELMDAFADGLNFYLSQHPRVTPRVIRHFEPWMALSFTEGSIGGDIERINLAQLQSFYQTSPQVSKVSQARDFNLEDLSQPAEPTGSNGVMPCC